MRRRGRPSNASQPDVARADAIIGQSVRRLLFCGFSLDEVCFQVGLAARAIGRVDDRGFALGPDRIKQIHDEWCARTETPHNRSRYAKHSLRERGPDGTLSELAATLVANGGEWLDDGRRFVAHHDPELTSKAHAEYMRTRLTRR